MLGTLASVAALLLSFGLLVLANGLFTTLLGIRTRIEGFATEQTGFIMAGYFTGLLVGGLLAVRVVSMVGHIRAFAAFASIMSVTALLHPLVVGPVSWFGMRLASGFCMAGMIMVTESWLNERASNVNRGRLLSFYMITNFLAAGSGQLVLPLADPGGFVLFSVASILFSLALVPVLMTQATAPRASSPHLMSLAALWRASPLGLVGAFCAGLVNAAFLGLGPVFARGAGLTLHQTSYLMASAILGGLLLQWPLGRLSDRLDRRRVIAGVSICSALSSLAIVWLARHHEPPAWLFVAAVAYGMFAFTVYSLSSAHTNDYASPDRLVQTSAALLVVYGVGAILGPLVASAVMGRVGPSGLFLHTAVVGVALAAYAVHRTRVRGALLASLKRRFVPQPGTQYVSTELYAAARDQMDRDLGRMLGGVRRY